MSNSSGGIASLLMVKAIDPSRATASAPTCAPLPTLQDVSSVLTKVLHARTLPWSPAVYITLLPSGDQMTAEVRRSSDAFNSLPWPPAIGTIHACASSAMLSMVVNLRLVAV